MPVFKRRFMAVFPVVLLAGAAFMWGAVVASADLPFSAEELEGLSRGEVVIRHQEKAISEEDVSSLLVGAIWVPHPPEVIWEVLNHPEREIEWIPGVKQSKLIKDLCPTPTTRTNTTDYRLGFFGIEAYYSTVREYDYEKKTIKGYMDKDRPHRFFQDIQSGWDLFPYKGGIIFQYWSDSKLTIDIPLPAFVSDALTERTVIAGVAAVAKRCDEVAQEMKKKKPAPVCPVLKDKIPGED